MPPINRLAIFSCDPGASTGVAWGIVDMTSDTVVEAMSNRTHTGSATYHHGRVEKAGPVKFQDIVIGHVGDIQAAWDWFANEFMHEFDKHGDIELEFVCEHFVLTGGRQHKPGVEGIFPAFLIGAIIAQINENLILQTASTGMRWNTQQHLKRYDAWIVGREHERSAFAHMAARVHARIR